MNAVLSFVQGWSGLSKRQTQATGLCSQRDPERIGRHPQIETLCYFDLALTADVALLS